MSEHEHEPDDERDDEREQESAFTPPPGATDDEPDAEPDAEPAPEPAPHDGPTPEEMERRFQKAERATKTYVASIARIFEDEANDLIPCPLCLEWARGYVHPQNVGNFADEQREAVGFILNGIEQVSYKPSPQHKACQVCDGFGVVRTGSKVVGNETASCDACAGFGYTPPPTTEQPATNGRTDFHAPAGEHPAPVATDDRDSWNEPRKLPDGRDNPNYGRMPQHKVTVAPYGITAGLGLQPAGAGSGGQ